MFCSSCGSPNDAGARFCARCGKQIQAAGAGPAPAAVPRPVAAWPVTPAPVAAAAQPAFQQQAAPGLASLGGRLLAVILDTILLLAVFMAIGMWAGRRMGGTTADGFSLNGGPALVVMGATALIGFLYYWWLEAVAGATLGKGIMGIQVRRRDGARCGAGPSLVRNLLRVIDGFAVYLLGFLVAIFSKSKQRIGDHAAGTVVLDRPAGGAARAALILLWLILVVGGFAGAYVLQGG